MKADHLVPPVPVEDMDRLDPDPDRVAVVRVVAARDARVAYDRAFREALAAARAEAGDDLVLDVLMRATGGGRDVVATLRDVMRFRH